MSRKSFKDFNFNKDEIKNATPKITQEKLANALNAKIIFGENERGFRGNIISNSFAKLQYFKEEVGLITLELDTKKTLYKLSQIAEDLNKRLPKKGELIHSNDVAAYIIKMYVDKVNVETIARKITNKTAVPSGKPKKAIAS